MISSDEINYTISLITLIIVISFVNIKVLPVPLTEKREFTLHNNKGAFT